ncbi:MAG: hypothetical protein GY820_48590, partial [Gammaproteobacteria bacterium]|nr:hypothetical protein [Gammaproteobacteria bacterium]
PQLPNEYQIYGPQNSQYTVPNTSSFQPFLNSFANQQGSGPPPGRGPTTSAGGTPPVARQFGPQPNLGSSNLSRPTMGSQDYAMPPAARPPTAPAYAGAPTWGAQSAGEGRQFAGPEPGHHAHHSGAQATGEGRCCNTRVQLPPLEPFDPDQSATREYALFETEFRQRMKLEKVPYSNWGDRLLCYLKSEARLFAYRWLSSYREGQWDFQMLTQALHTNFQVQNTADLYQRSLTTLLWDPNKDTIKKHLSTLRTLVMQAFPNFSSEWNELVRQYLLNSMPGNFYEYVSGRNNEPLENLVKGIRAVAAFKKEQGTLKSSSDDKRNPIHAQSVPQRRGGISNIDQNYLPYYQSPTVIQQSVMPSPYPYTYELGPQNAFQVPRRAEIRRVERAIRALLEELPPRPAL